MSVWLTGVASLCNQILQLGHESRLHFLSVTDEVTAESHYKTQNLKFQADSNLPCPRWHSVQNTKPTSSRQSPICQLAGVFCSTESAPGGIPTKTIKATVKLHSQHNCNFSSSSPSSHPALLWLYFSMEYDFPDAFWSELLEWRDNPYDGSTANRIRIFDVALYMYKQLRQGKCSLCGHVWTVEGSDPRQFAKHCLRHITPHHPAQALTCFYSSDGDQAMRTLLHSANLIGKEWGPGATTELVNWRRLSLFGDPEVALTLTSSLAIKARRFGLMGLIQEYRKLTDSHIRTGRLTINVPWENRPFTVNASELTFHLQEDGSYRVRSRCIYVTTAAHVLPLTHTGTAGRHSTLRERMAAHSAAANQYDGSEQQQRSNTRA